MKGAPNRQRAKASYAQPPPPKQLPDQRNFTNSRDSDASYCSSRPSSIGITARSAATGYIKDRSYQSSAIGLINEFLSLHSSPVLIKPPLPPSSKLITETLGFVISSLDYPCNKVEDDLSVILKFMNCPFKLKVSSAIRAPSHHNWPTTLAVIHWLVQLAMYNEHVSSTTQPSVFQDNSTLVYSLNSYLHYINGDDDSVEALDREFIEKLERERDSIVEQVTAMRQEVVDLEAKLEGLKTGPSPKELLEKERRMLEEDVSKFHAMIADVQGKIALAKKVLEVKEKDLHAKVEANAKICEENDVLEKKIESQTFNARDVERMKRELQAVERNIGENEVARSLWEEKAWDIDSVLGRQYKELEALSIECNQAMKRLKLGNEIQYLLNAKGTTPSEVLGVNYKSSVKPALDSFSNEIKKSSMERLEELISLQQQSVETAATIDGKRKQLSALQARIDEMEAHSKMLKKETQEYTSRCAMEANKFTQDIELEAHNLDIVEKEAADMLKAANLNLQEETKGSEEEIQMAARELFAIVDSVSKHKEYASSKIAEMRGMLMETASFVADTYKTSLTAQFGIDFGSNC